VEETRPSAVKKSEVQVSEGTSEVGNGLQKTLSSAKTPGKTVELPLTFDPEGITSETQEVKIPRFSAFQMQLILNLDAMPILADEAVQNEVVRMMDQYMERLNAFRSVVEKRSESTMLKAAAERQLRIDTRAFSRLKKEAWIQICEEKEEDSPKSSKKKYTNDSAREAALAAKIQTDPQMRELDERVFKLEIDIAGYNARLESLRLESKALETEIRTARDGLNWFVNASTAIAHVSEYMGEDGSGPTGG